MKMVFFIFLSMTALSGCMIGEIWSVRTVEEIQRSEYRADLSSTQAPDAVNRCMMQALHGHQNAKGKRPYVYVETRDFGTTHEIALRSPRTFAPGL